jgi:hypothetical protein
LERYEERNASKEKQLTEFLKKKEDKKSERYRVVQENQ